MIGFGHLARRLIELLRPFDVEIVAFDPFVPRELAEAYGVDVRPAGSGARSRCRLCRWCPLHARHDRDARREELERLRPGSVLVNVSRGAVIDSDALLARLARR